MQVPEKLTLIGGGILLSSLLVFTLKSQASNLLPKVAQPIESIQDRTSDTQNGNDFSDAFKDAQKDNLKTGTWGTSKWYIDKDNNMHIGPGKLEGRLYDAIQQNAYSIQGIDFDGNAQAPPDSHQLLSGVDDINKFWNFNIKSINHLNRLDVSHAQDMLFIFGNDSAIQSLDLNGWDTSNVTSLDGAFINNVSLSDLRVNSLNVSQVNNFGWMFLRDGSLQNVDLSGWHTNSNQNPGMPLTFAGATSVRSLDLSNFDTTRSWEDNILGGKYTLNESGNLQKLTLGDKTIFGNDAGTIQGTWKNGDQVMSGDQFKNSQPHPGTWIKQ